MHTSMGGGAPLSLAKAVASTEALTPGDNALHTDVFQGVDSNVVVVGCSCHRVGVPELQLPTGCYRSSTRLRSSLPSEKSLCLPVVFRFRLALLCFEVQGRGLRGIRVSDNGRNNWESNPLFLVQHSCTWEKGSPSASKPLCVRTPCWG